MEKRLEEILILHTDDENTIHMRNDKNDTKFIIRKRQLKCRKHMRRTECLENVSLTVYIEGKRGRENECITSITSLCKLIT